VPPFDATAAAAVDAAASGIAPAWFIFLDIVGDPIRAANYSKPVTFASTGDSDLDGNTFGIVAGQEVISVGDVALGDGGSDTLNVTLSGLASIDATLLAAIGDRTKWQGRLARIWMAVCDVNGVQQGVIVPWYTGYMVSVDIGPSPTTQTIQLHIENYLAAFSQASNRSYLGQKDYDPADNSAAATLAAANGTAGPGASTVAVGGGGSLDDEPGNIGGMIGFNTRQVNGQ
jgi:hypothetical protein